jgi:hypothetical protein
MFTEYSLNVHWMFRTLQSQHKTNTTFGCLDPVQVILTECSLDVHWMLTKCSLNVHRIFTRCSLSCMFPKLQGEHKTDATFGCLDPVQVIVTECSLNVHWWVTECSLNVHRMVTECSLNVHWMFPECSLNGHWMVTECSARFRASTRPTLPLGVSTQCR